MGAGTVGNTIGDHAVFNGDCVAGGGDIAAITGSITADDLTVLQGHTALKVNIAAAAPVGRGFTANDAAAQDLQSGVAFQAADAAAVAIGQATDQQTVIHTEGRAGAHIHQTAGLCLARCRVPGNSAAVQLEQCAGDLIVLDLDHAAGAGGVCFSAESAAAYRVDHCQVTIDQEQTGLPLGGDGMAPQVKYHLFTGNHDPFTVLNIVAVQVVVTGGGIAIPGLPVDLIVCLAAATGTGAVDGGGVFRGYCCRSRQDKHCRQQTHNQQERKDPFFHKKSSFYDVWGHCNT